MNYKVIDLRTVMNPNTKLGGICFVESNVDIPFEIKRVYYIFNTEDGQHRGFHSHKENWQLLACPYGSIEVILNDGESTETVWLDKPTKALLMAPCLWRELIWHQDDAVLCVAASEYYNPDEYIRNYDEYLEFVKSQKIKVRL